MTRRTVPRLAAAALLLILPAVVLASCGSPPGATQLLKSERQLTGMYEGCKTFKLKDGGKTSIVEVSALGGMPQVEVHAILKRANGMTKPVTVTGVRLGDVLDSKGVARPFRELKVEAWDGYVGRVSYDIAVLPDTVLALTMDGGPIPREDGPTRLVVASQDGFYWVRMITSIEVLR